MVKFPYSRYGVWNNVPLYDSENFSSSGTENRAEVIHTQKLLTVND